MFNKGAIQKSERAITVFQAYLDLNITGLVDIIDNTIAEKENEITLNSHRALGIAMANIAEFAEENYTIFCSEYNEQVIVAHEKSLCVELCNELIKEDVKGTLNQIVNTLRVGVLGFCNNLNDIDENAQISNIAELNGLHTLLRLVRSASSLCAQSISCHQNNNDDKLKKETLN